VSPDSQGVSRIVLSRALNI